MFYQQTFQKIDQFHGYTKLNLKNLLQTNEKIKIQNTLIHPSAGAVLSMAVLLFLVETPGIAVEFIESGEIK